MTKMSDVQPLGEGRTPEPPSIIKIYERRLAKVKAREQKNRAHRFFLQLDVLTNHDLLEHPDYLKLYKQVFGKTSDGLTDVQRRSLASSIDLMRELLAGRTLRRGALARQGLSFFPDERPSEEPYAVSLAGAVERRMREAFAFLDRGGDSPMPDEDKLLAYFRDFVLGRLRVEGCAKPSTVEAEVRHRTRRALSTHGIPNGSYYFSFAEAALLFCDHDTNRSRAYWEKTLSAFVMTAEVFTDLFWTGAGRNQNSYGPDALEKRVYNTKWDALQAAFKRYGYGSREKLEEVFGQVVARAFRDQLVQKFHVAPSHLE